MSLDWSFIGREFEGQSLLVTRSRLRSFARATGQDDPIYTDLEAARQVGHRDLPVPPTFVFGIEFESADLAGYFTDLGVDLRTVLHGDQEFIYREMAYAGDVLTTSSRIADIYEKKNGALQFIVRDTRVCNQDGTVISEMRSTTVVQNK